MSSVHEPTVEYAEPTEDLSRTVDTEVTIKFISKESKEKNTEVKASKEKLIAGSGYFATHWLEHPRSTVTKAPKFIVPGVTITQLSIDVAIRHLHGHETNIINVADAIELILLARAFGIPTLETVACGHVEEALERTLKTEGLADGIRELYDGLSDDPHCAVGNDVVEVVISIFARCCRKRWALLRTDAAFKLLCKDFPQLLMDILDVVADEDEKQVKVEEKGSVPPQDSPRELLE